MVKSYLYIAGLCNVRRRVSFFVSKSYLPVLNIFLFFSINWFLKAFADLYSDKFQFSGGLCLVLG